MTYHRPGTLDQALQICARPNTRVLVGGTDIYPAQSGRDLTGEVLDLTGIGALSGISETNEGWRFGATTRWTDIINAELPPAFDGLKQAAREVGSVQIQNSGTLAGNLCNASPAADGVPPLMVLQARIELASASARRNLSLSEFLLGPRKTALAADEIVTAIHIPKAATLGQSAFVKLGARKYLVISIAMVAVRLEIAEGLIQKAAVAVGACSPMARMLPGLAAAMTGIAPTNSAAWQKVLHREIAQHLTPIDDIRADAAYRRDAVAELIDRAIKKAVNP